MSKPFLLTDIDGVVLNWIEGFLKYLKRKKIKTKPNSKSHEWNLEKWVIHDDIMELINSFNHSHYFEFLSGYTDAADVISNLQEHFNIVGITSCSDKRETIIRRKRNLKHLGLNFYDVICLSMGEDKTDTLKKYPKSIWIEDSLKNAIKGSILGHSSILLDKKYNKCEDREDLLRVEDWYDIYAEIMFNGFGRLHERKTRK